MPIFIGYDVDDDDDENSRLRSTHCQMFSFGWGRLLLRILLARLGSAQLSSSQITDNMADELIFLFLLIH
jgi:hypothetical protein